jgi:hypothetical protein
MAKAAQAWAKCHHHGKGVVEQKTQRLRDQPQAQQPRIDHPAIAQDDFPGEDPQQIRGPERNGQKDQPEEFAPGVKGHEVGHGIGQCDGQHGHEGRHHHRAREQDAVAFPPQNLAILGQGPTGLKSNARLAFQAGDQQQDQGRGQRQPHHHQGGGEQGIALPHVPPAIRHTAPFTAHAIAYWAIRRIWRN